jgi:hypothetical protein
MKHIKGIHESDWWDSDPSAPWNQDNPDPETDKELTPAEKVFSTLGFDHHYAVLSKKGAKGELWLMLLDAVDGEQEFLDFIPYYREDDGWGSSKEYESADEHSIEDFATCVYRGDYKDHQWLKPSEAVCEDPNASVSNYEDGPAFLIKISGALSELLIDEFAKDYSKARSIDSKEGLKDMINVISKAYPEGRLLPGEDPQQAPEA